MVHFHSGNICDAINEVDIENLEGINAVSEVSQAEQIEGIVGDGHCSPGYVSNEFLFRQNNHLMHKLFLIVINFV